MKTMLRILAVLIALAFVGIAVASMRCGPGQPCVFLPIVTSQVTSSATAVLPPTATPTLPPTITATPMPTVTQVPPPSPTPTVNPQPTMMVGLAILGDSTQDEYRADNPRGGDYGDTTFNWVELLAIVRGINLGEWGTRPEPRRSGYAFNWARSGASSDQMINDGQHTGTARQILDGEVSHAVIQIGINDFYFSGLGLEIYEGTVTGEQLRARLDAIANNIITAARTLQETERCAVLVAATQDYLTLPVVPELYVAYSDPVGRQRFVDAVAYLNQALERLSAEAGVRFFDFNAAYLVEIQSRLDNDGFLIVGGERIDLRTRGDNPRFGLLDDGYVHPGTVLSGLYAKVYIEAFNRSFGTAITPLTDNEMLQAAGIRP